MKTPSHRLSFAVVVSVGLFLRATACAEPPSAPSDPGTNAKAGGLPRSKPQVIYHLPRASNYAATLHSQAKRPGTLLPVDTSMPTSLQLSRSAANAEALQAQREAQRNVEQAPANTQPVERKRTIKRSHSKSPSPRFFSPGPGKGKGNFHPGKGRKK
ncbi:MAG TPA: hypothetical protein VM940_12950 [Chthoniobacterales bacterium]|nr:hypothetical protein [Chthoniobacterales bacterium]